MIAAARPSDLEEICQFLGFAPQHIFYLVENSHLLYSTIEIPKHNNPSEVRTLDIPSSELKGVQRAILRSILSTVTLSPQVYSYVSGRSVVSACANFCPGKAVLHMDIRGFFPAINFGRVFGLFMSLGYNSSVSFILTRLCVKGNTLSQGAPTSPALSNIVCRKLDRNLSKLSKSWELEF